LGARATSDPRAYEAWLRTMHECQRLTKESVEQARKLAEEALTTIGDDALLHAALGYVLYVSYDFWYSHDEETLRRAEAASARALALNPELSQAALSMAVVSYKRGNVAGFRRYARRAVELERNADALAWWGLALGEAGRAEEARVVSYEAVARDPLYFLPIVFGALAAVADARFEEAYRRLARAVDGAFHDDCLTVWWLGQSAAYAGHDDEAKAALARVEAIGEQPLAGWAEVMRLALEGDGDGVRSAIQKAGLRDAARSDEYVPTYLAACLARIGESAEALSWIEHAMSWGFVAHRFYETNRFYAPLRGDPRFEALLERAREKERAFEA